MNHILPSGWEQELGSALALGSTTHSGAQGASWEDVKVRSRAWRGDLAKGNSFSCVFHMKIQNFSGW